jgi:hypothetical protein
MAKQPIYLDNFLDTWQDWIHLDQMQEINNGERDWELRPWNLIYQYCYCTNNNLELFFITAVTEQLSVQKRNAKFGS